jgi:hypothetical protein
LVGKPEGNRSLGRPRCRWEDNIKTDFQKVRCGGMDWIGLAQDRDKSFINCLFLSLFCFRVQAGSKLFFNIMLVTYS